MAVLEPSMLGRKPFGSEAEPAARGGEHIFGAGKFGALDERSRARLRRHDTATRRPDHASKAKLKEVSPRHDGHESE